MAMALIKEAGITLISDDEPLVDKDCNILPFHTRIGTLDQGMVESIPREFWYQIDRMEFGKKYFIDRRFWDDKLRKTPVKNSVLFVTSRVLNGEPEIEPCGKITALRTLFRDAVVGVGLFQGIEFLFANSSWEVLGKAWVAMRRLGLAIKLVRKSRTYRLTLTQDIPRNTQVLTDFIRGAD